MREIDSLLRLLLNLAVVRTNLLAFSLVQWWICHRMGGGSRKGRERVQEKRLSFHYCFSWLRVNFQYL